MKKLSKENCQKISGGKKCSAKDRVLGGVSGAIVGALSGPAGALKGAASGALGC
ncbi:Blp family class II bacteriocin [Staphylococcus felis]|uniref:Blp family class II bacteriocin n=1 Tax=Staphylococcus felis TaxID=46127 RepID=UPI002480DBE5|nr:Blp family class II bacteriocin [Staphylococcus felis]MDQ7193974.1 Blp family class II bacteriocin [Staphylococcus felis]